MNVVKRESNMKKPQSRVKNELVRKDTSYLGLRGPTWLLPVFNSSSRRPASIAPRYQFSNEESSSASKRPSMGPPTGLPKSAKRRIISNSTSTRLESSSSGMPRPRVLASDSVVDTSHDFSTPMNRPTALRYISSSSRGGHSGQRSARSTSTSAVEPSVILAISEGRGMARGEIGIAAVDLRHPHLVLCQFSDTLLYTHTLTKINFFNPVEIIVPHTFCEGVQPSQLYKLIKDHYPLVNLTTVQRRHFNDAAGRQQIQQLCAPQYSAVYLQVLQKFYALTAAAALLKYVEYIQCIVFARESLKIEYHSSENTVVIDVGTATQLELVQPLVPSAGPTCCLLGVLGPTYTIGGIRALRASILQPSCNKEFIENRLDAVQDLIENDTGLMTALQDVLKKLSDIDKILLLCMESQNQNMEKLGEAQLNQTLLLKTTMDMVPKILEALDTAQSGRLKKIKMDLENPHYKEIADHIRSIIQEDAHLEKGVMGCLQRCFAIKPDINGLLDVARRTYSELIEDIQKVVEQLSENYDLPLRLNQNVMKGFHIVLSIAPKNRRNFNIEDLPPIFIQVQNSGASISMTTEELVVMDQQAKESLNEIQKMSNIVISGLLKELRPFMSSLYKLCEDVAELDILLALAQASTVGSYIRPDFNTYLDVRNSVHPLLDYNSRVIPVPNDIFASPEYNFTVITGPNMGGKSIYIKQIALMQIMAQLGCYLPATHATLRICDRIFSRIGFNDSVELNASTFVIEMKEMQHILTGMTSSSLVIIDELCRGTNLEEGTSIAWAICEELIMSDAFTFFTTHFMQLTRLQELYCNVVNRHTMVNEELGNSECSQSQRRLIYKHKIELGTTKINRYGLALAAKTNLPEDTVKLAMELSELIIKDRLPQEIRTPEECDEKLLYDLNANIRQESRKCSNANEKIKQILINFKEQNQVLIERLRLQSGGDSSKTDKSVVVPISRNQRRSEEDPIKPVNELKTLQTLVNAQRNFQHNKSQNAITSNEICAQETRSKSSEEKQLTQGPGTVQSYSRAPRPLRFINANSDDDNNKNDNQHCTTVKSSTELLTTFRNTNDDYLPEKNISHDNESTKTSREASNVTEDHEQLGNAVSGFDEKTDNDFQNIGSLILNKISGSTTSQDIDENSIVINSSYSGESNFDIADALTQVIEGCSLEELNSVDNKEDDSTDEELMSEAVKEIRDDLISSLSVENIILTPPIGFRD